METQIVKVGEEVVLYGGNCLKVLKTLPEESVDLVITSPPYWGLRDYGTGIWEGGNPNCDHTTGTQQSKRSTLAGNGHGRGKQLSPQLQNMKVPVKGNVCHCGAVRTTDEIGSEATADCLAALSGLELCGACYVCRLVLIFRQLRRVLKDTGSVWLNLGDSYSSGGRKGHGTRVGYKQRSNRGMNGENDPPRVDCGLPDGNLVGIPWRVALALQADGWIIRSDVPWVKRNPLPESASSRPARSLEYFFLLAKRKGYYFDMTAIRKHSKMTMTEAQYEHAKRISSGEEWYSPDETNTKKTKAVHPSGRNFRNNDLWFSSLGSCFGAVGLDDELVGLDVIPKPFPGAHFAVFSPELIKPLILAGSSSKGCCSKCGAPWKRMEKRETTHRKRPNAHIKYADGGPSGQPDQTKAGVSIVTLGWEASCECKAKVTPCVVCDPFSGAGTTGLVAIREGRHYIGIELSPEYLEISRKRLASRGKSVELAPTDKRKKEAEVRKTYELF